MKKTSAASFLPSRRQMMAGTGGVASVALMRGFTADAIAAQTAATFTHGVASGDPLQDRVILWTRVVPDSLTKRLTVDWQVASDEMFERVLASGKAHASIKSDFTVKVDASGLQAGQKYYYRFMAAGVTSMTGRTRTLPEGTTTGFSMAAVSCSNYPQGFFHVYREVANADVAVVLHLGDYIYEYPAGTYSNDYATDTLGRVVAPKGEIIALEDYRTRYGLYRADPDLQAVHAAHPFICVWDDHEIANDTWKTGAQNHNEGEGDFNKRKAAALQAYHEWLPIRDNADGDMEKIYRSFEIGDLASVIMLDTRIVGRTEPLSYSKDIPLQSFTFDFNPGVTPRAVTDANELEELQADSERSGHLRSIPVPFRMGGEKPTPILNWEDIQAIDPNALPEGISYLPDMTSFKTNVLGDEARSLLGAEQTEFLNHALSSSKRKGKPWQVIGQQILTGKVGVPMVRDEDIDQDSKSFVSPEQLAQFRMLGAYGLPLNLDAWDGYPAARNTLFKSFKAHANNVVTLAGDTHNAWAFNMKDEEGDPVAVEFATAGVSSPGMETYLPAEPNVVADALLKSSPELQFIDSQHRGWLRLSLSQSEATAEWHFINSVLEENYELLPPVVRTTKAGEHSISE